MFERYTEKARRVIFFARYEASQYGAAFIESEHLLLGLLREDWALNKRILRQKGTAEDIRKEIEGQITIGKRVSTSVEMPLSVESKHILNWAFEEAERLGDKHVGTEHLLLGILREEKCLAARVLQNRGVALNTLRVELAERSETQGGRSLQERAALLEKQMSAGGMAEAVVSLSELINAWNDRNEKKFAGFFAEDGQFADSQGQTWSGKADIEKGAARVFGSFQQGASPGRVEDAKFVGSDAATASIVWNAEPGVKAKAAGSSGLRMTLILFATGSGWRVARARLTEVRASSSAA